MGIIIIITCGACFHLCIYFRFCKLPEVLFDFVHTYLLKGLAVCLCIIYGNWLMSMHTCVCTRLITACICVLSIVSALKPVKITEAVLIAHMCS